MKKLQPLLFLFCILPGRTAHLQAPLIGAPQQNLKPSTKLRLKANMTEYRVSVNNKQLDVTVLNIDGQKVDFLCNGKTYSVSVTPNQASWAPQSDSALKPPSISPAPAAAAPTASSSNEVAAPMPGKVVQIFVKPGAQVKKGDNLAIIEAMKMENNIPSPLSGKVATVHVEAGAQVEVGQVLVSFEIE